MQNSTQPSSTQLILASQSRQRQQLFETLGVPHQVIPSQIDESLIQDPDFKLRAQLVAKAKADAVAANHPGSVVVAADTYIVLDGEMLEKPRNLGEARDMLRRQSGRWSQAVTGFCYLDQLHQWSRVETVLTEVEFRPLTDLEIERYVTQQPVLEWSAAYCPAYIEGMMLVAQIKGSLTSFTHGLPFELLMESLKKTGLV